MKRLIIIAIVLMLSAATADASLFNLNGLKKNYFKNFNLFGGQHHHHSNNWAYLTKVPETPTDPNKPTVPPLDPVDPGLPHLPNDPGTPVNPVPEPASVILLGSGLLALAGYKRWRGDK